MTHENGEREKRIQEIMIPLEKTDAKDIVVALGQGLVSMTPYAGGLIAELLGVRLPDFQMKRLRRFVAELADDFQQLKAKIDSDYVRKEEFTHILQKTFRGVAENYQKEKLDALRAVLVNSCIIHQADEELKEYLVTIALELGTLHLRVIKILGDPRDFYVKKGLKDYRDEMALGGSIIESLRACLPEVPDDYVRSVWNDLYTRNLVSTEARVLGAMLSGKGSRTLEGRLSDLGKQLYAYISSPMQ